MPSHSAELRYGVSCVRENGFLRVWGLNIKDGLLVATKCAKPTLIGCKGADAKFWAPLLGARVTLCLLPNHGSHALAKTSAGGCE